MSFAGGISPDKNVNTWGKINGNIFKSGKPF
jgi:hypothetical protein